MAWSFVLAAVLAESIITTWASTAEIASPGTADPEDMTWNESDWAGISRTPIPIGEVLNAHERTLTVPHDGLPTASLRLDISNPMAYEIVSRMRPTSDLPNAAVILLKVYEGTTLRFVGDCTNVELSGGEDGSTTLQANFAGPLWRTQHRLAKKLGVLGLSPAQPNVQWTDTSPGDIITELLTYANTEVLDTVGIGDTGIRMGTVDTLPAPPSVGVEPPWNYKPLAEAIMEMQAAGIAADLIGAFDFLVRPVEPVSDSYGLKLAELDIRTKIGTARPDVVFEYGDGSLSAKGSRLSMERQNIVNRAYVQGADPADDTVTVRGVNADSQVAYSLYEALTPIDLGDGAGVLRQAWADANVQVRGDTQLIADFDPAVNAPAWGQDPPTDGAYGNGDTIRVRIKLAEIEFLDGNMRVLGVTISIDDEDKVTVKPKFTAD